MKLTRKQVETVWCALSDAIRDRETFLEAYTFPRPTQDPEVLRIRKLTKDTLTRYHRLQKRIGELLRSTNKHDNQTTNRHRHRPIQPARNRPNP